MNEATIGRTNRGKGARRWLLLIAATGALMLLALGHTPAGAVSLTASKNPVLIEPGMTTGQTEIKWSGLPTGPTTFVALYINDVITVPAPLPAAGKHKLTVTQGNTYVVQLRDVLTGGALASLTITAPLPACPKNCFNIADVTPHGTFAGFNVQTAGQTKLRVEIGEQPANADFVFPSVVASKEDGFSANHALNLSTLKANTTYHYVIRAEDTLGFKYHRRGTFTTLKRTINVSFSSIHVLDDSDDLSDGDLLFWFTIGGSPMVNLTYADDEVGTGDTLAIAVNSTITNAPTQFGVKVSGLDDDDDFGGGLCSNGLIPFGSGSNDCADWITKEVNTAVIGLGGPGEAYTAPLSFTLSEIGVPLAFQVTGTYTVSYV